MSDRFESYETTLRNCLTESKEALTAKGVEVPEETKLRNVPALIDGIEVGHSGNAITINCKDEAFLGQTLTARHTDGTTVTKVIDSLTAVIEIPKDGEWTVSNSLTKEQFKFTFDTVRDLYEFQQATLNIVCTSSTQHYNGYLTYNVKNPLDQVVFTHAFRESDWPNYSPGTYTGTHTITSRGEYSVEFVNNNAGRTICTKKINIIENNKTYQLDFYITNYEQVVSDPSLPEQPGFSGQETLTDSEILSNLTVYAVDATSMTEQQQEEIFTEINNMVEEAKSDEEINAYISSKEAEYGQI